VSAEQEWHPRLDRDPRVTWLATLLRSLDGEKVLLICRSRRKAIAIEAAMRQITKAPLGVFHEGLSLIQRDRSAAWFADPDGARLLICSEIGSEGRNFQFTHHLVLFDLPLDAGLLEQRIGRLDRIGQRSAIQVHVPVVPGTHLEVLARWYHEGLDAFAETAAGGRQLMEQFNGELVAAADAAGMPQSSPHDPLAVLIRATLDARAEVSRRLAEGRDRLLEWNSCKPAVAARIVAAIQASDADTTLDAFMLEVFDHFFIEVEAIAPRTYRLGSAGVLRDTFPGLTSGDLAVTADRARALVREEQQFLTWDHPLVSGALDLLLGGDHGNCSAVRWVDDGSGLYLETIYVLECVAPVRLHVGRYLPPTAVRVVVDHRGREAAGVLTDAVVAALRPIPGSASFFTRPEIRDRLLPTLVDRTKALAEAQAPDSVAAARERMHAELGREEARLKALQKVNRSVRDSEIAHLAELRSDLDRVLDDARLRLDAVRVIHQSPERLR
jgi:ATP-dependent helicase HepA